MKLHISFLLKLLYVLGFYQHTTLISADPIENLESFVQENISSSVDFSQIVYDIEGEEIQATTGSLKFQRPGKFRWHYKEPFEQLIVSNGKTLWVYDKDLEQVIIRSIGGSFGSSPAALLAGSDEIDSYYLMEGAGDGVGQEDSLVLKPLEQDGMFKKIKITFLEKNISTMELFDYLGQKTIIHFSKFNKQTSFKPKTFQFIAPEGVDVLME